MKAGQPERQGGEALPPMRSFLDEVSLLGCCSLKDLGPVGWKAIARIVIVVQLLSWVQLFGALMDCSPPGSSVHGILRQEYRSGLPFPSPGEFSNPGIKPESSALAGGFFATEPPGKPKNSHSIH